MGGPNCKIFLPAMPIEFGNADPNSSFQIFPLRFFVENLIKFWDNQKHTLMMSNPDQITYITEPEPGGDFGVISQDGTYSLTSLPHALHAMHIS